MQNNILNQWYFINEEILDEQRVSEHKSYKFLFTK